MSPFRLSGTLPTRLLDPQGKPFFSLGVVHTGAYAEGEGQALFEQKYGGDPARLSAKIAADLRAWNFNTAGYHSPPALHDHLPFLQDCYPAPISYWMGRPNYPDVFAPAYQRQVEELMECTCAPVRDHPNLIGYYWTDTPRWDLERARRQVGTDWVSAMRALPPTAPGKQRYVQSFMKALRYGGLGDESDLYHLPAPYRLALGGAGFSMNEVGEDLWENLMPKTLLACTFPHLDTNHPAVAEHDRKFLGEIAAQYYKVVHMATRKSDPNHLIFGDRYLADDHPAEVLNQAVPYIDALAIQPYDSTFDRGYFDNLRFLAQGKPILICDHAINFPTPQYPQTLWPQVPDEAAAAQAYHAYVSAAAACPYIIGYHRCQYIDRPRPGASLLKQGLLQADETPYEVLVEQVKKTNEQVVMRDAGWGMRN